jgi:hypothetical protein
MVHKMEKRSSSPEKLQVTHGNVVDTRPKKQLITRRSEQTIEDQTYQKVGQYQREQEDRVKKVDLDPNQRIPKM